jgi:hypothetical protein
MYKRAEDGIVLVDQDRCRGWRMCVSGCPYKKMYFNHKTGKAEKCTLCYPRIEVGMPTVCSETCVGRLRYLGLVLYDVDRVAEAASVDNNTELYEAQRRILLDPNDPAVIAGARAEGISDEWIDAAQRSPVYALINTYRVALPLHPEYRTMPMVWYIPPLSPVVDAVSSDGHDGEDLGNLFGALDSLRIPIQYLAEPFTAGDTDVVAGVLKRLAAMHSYMRDINLGRETQPHIPHSVGMTEEQIYHMYRLLAVAKYEERYVIPTAYVADLPTDLPGAGELGCSLSIDGGPGMYESDPVPVAGETFHARRRNQVNLLNWDGVGAPPHCSRRPGDEAALRRPRPIQDAGDPRPAGAAVGVAAAGLPRRRAGGVRGAPGHRRRAAPPPVRSRGGPAGPHGRGVAWPQADRRRDRLRGDLRPAAARHDVPDVLDRRGHPQPWPGHAGVRHQPVFVGRVECCCQLPNHLHARGGLIGPSRSSRVCTSTPSITGITRYSRPSISPVSWMGMMWGSVSRAATWASRRNRDR